MAEQPDGNTSDTDGNEAVDEATRERSGLSMWLVIVPLILLPAGVGAWLAWSKYEDLSRLAAETRVRFTSDEQRDAGPREYGQFVKLEGMIINPAGSDGKRFLLVDIGMESSTGAVLSELEQKDIVVRDTILKVLGSRTVEELSSLDTRTTLKTELRDAVNAILQRGTVDYLYFTQFVLQ